MSTEHSICGVLPLDTRSKHAGHVARLTSDVLNGRSGSPDSPNRAKISCLSINQGPVTSVQHETYTTSSVYYSTASAVCAITVRKRTKLLFIVVGLELFASQDELHIHVTSRRVHETSCRRKAIIIIYLRLCARVALPSKQSACATLYLSVASLAQIYFSILSHKRYDFREKKKKVTEHKICVLIFSTIFIWNVSHSKKNSATYCHICEYVFI